MQEDFHYYATYCAAYIAGYSHRESLDICYSANFVDLCSKTLLSRIKAPLAAATTQLSMEMMDMRTDIIGLQDITRIWASFHFLPYDLYADVRKGSPGYKRKYRLICGPNSDLIVDTVNLAKGRSLQAAGLAMHVLADTWAHRYFAGTPSLVINNTNSYFFELLPAEGEEGKAGAFTERRIDFRHSPSAADDPDKGLYSNSIYQIDENSIMNLGHGRAGHLPDYSFIRYRYLPAWGGYKEVVKDNPSDYMHAFCQMICALKYLRGANDSFDKDQYDWDAAAPWKDRIERILTKRQPIACDDWKELGEELSGQVIEPFDINRYLDEYTEADAEGRDDTFLGRFTLAALAQKSMVTNKIYSSGNRLAGFSVDYGQKGLKGIKDYFRLVEIRKRQG